MKRLKLFIETYKKILVSSAYALAVTCMTILLNAWSKFFAYTLVFVVVLELTYTVISVLVYDEKEEGYGDM